MARIFLCLSHLHLGPGHIDDPGVLGTAAGPATLFAIPPQGADQSILVLSSDPCLHVCLPATRSGGVLRGSGRWCRSSAILHSCVKLPEGIASLDFRRS